MDRYSKVAAEGDGTRSPWKGAAIGAGGGSLLAAALGYIYGHRGRWLAYDTLAGGLTGGAAGYAIDSVNNNEIKQNANPGGNTPDDVKYTDSSTADELGWSREFRDMRDKARKSLALNPTLLNKVKAYFTGDIGSPDSYAASSDERAYKELRKAGMPPDMARKGQQAASAAKGTSPLRLLQMLFKTDKNDTSREDAQLAAAGMIFDPVKHRVRQMTTAEQLNYKSPKQRELPKIVSNVDYTPVSKHER